MDITTGLWIVVGLFIVGIVIGCLFIATRSGDEEEHDIEHLDHQVHG